MIMRGLVIACAATASSGLACTIIWDEDDAKRRSDAVVWGTFTPGLTIGRGTLKVSRREKGPATKELRISWDVAFVDDGANCPVWQPNPEYPRGRFFLHRESDGSFTVEAQTPAKKART